MNARSNELTRHLTNVHDINHLHNHWIGLEQFFSQLTPVANQNPTYPPYNIERINDEAYRVVIALAGFTANRLSIELLNGELIVKGIENLPEPKYQPGIYTPDTNVIEYIHKGIANRSFTLKFHLSPEIVIDNSKFIDGLLLINMHREVPETKKSRLIKIN
jgi:molecular chaperone IbpA